MAVTISGTSGLTFPDASTMATGSQACKAWVNFNGTTSPPTVRASYNVSSVTKLSTGIYYVYFATAMSDDKYATTFGGCRVVGTSSDYGFCPQMYGQSTTLVAMNTPSTTGSTAEWERVMISVFR